MYWLAYEGHMFMGVEGIDEVLKVLRMLRAQRNEGRVDITWVQIRGLSLKG